MALRKVLYSNLMAPIALTFMANHYIKNKNYGYSKRFNVLSYSDGESSIESLKVVDTIVESVESEESEEEKAYWREKRNCSFCSMFLDSPCSNQFKLWSRCIDKAKEEGEEENYIEACSEVSMALFLCQDQNKDYFKNLMDELSKEKESKENDLSEDEEIENLIADANNDENEETQENS